MQPVYKFAPTTFSDNDIEFEIPAFSEPTYLQFHAVRGAVMSPDHLIRINYLGAVDGKCQPD